MSLRASLSEKEDISLGGFSDRFSKPRKGTLRQYTTSSDSSGLSFRLTCEGREKLVSYLKPCRGLTAARAAADLRRLLFRRVLHAVCHFFVGAGGEAGVAAVLSQLSQVRNVLLPLYQDATPQRLEPRSFGKSEMTGGSWEGGGSVCSSCVPYLRRGQILQPLRSEGPGEKFASQDGAQVFGHDGLLLHRAVIFQGQD